MHNYSLEIILSKFTLGTLYRNFKASKGWKETEIIMQMRNSKFLNMQFGIILFVLKMGLYSTASVVGGWAGVVFHHPV